MDKKLHLLESFPARGADGASYKVMGYEHMVRTDTLHDGQDHWESTGLLEYRLASGEQVEVDAEGRMRVAGSGIDLQRAVAEPAAVKPAAAAKAGGRGKARGAAASTR